VALDRVGQHLRAASQPHDAVPLGGEPQAGLGAQVAAAGDDDAHRASVPTEVRRGLGELPRTSCALAPQQMPIAVLQLPTVSLANADRQASNSAFFGQ
jgi:hypothetical protein